MNNSVAAIFAHPDDEVLGCGAALAAHTASGDRVRILLLATGLAARGTVDESALKALRVQAEAASGILGVETVSFDDFPDNAMDTVPLLEVVRRVESFLDRFPAGVVYTHHGGDLNVDHGITQRAVVTACRPLPEAMDRTVLGCEINSATEWGTGTLDPFVPTEFLDIEPFMEKKIRALECYSDELRDWPHPRSSEGIRTLARWRGCQSGFAAAEAFVTLRRTRSAP